MGEPHGAMATRPGRALTSTVTHCTPAPSAGTHPRESASLFGTPPPPASARGPEHSSRCPSHRTDRDVPFTATTAQPATEDRRGCALESRGTASCKPHCAGRGGIPLGSPRLTEECVPATLSQAPLPHHEPEMKTTRERPAHRIPVPPPNSDRTAGGRESPSAATAIGAHTAPSGQQRRSRLYHTDTQTQMEHVCLISHFQQGRSRAGVEAGGRGLSQELTRLSLQSEPPGLTVTGKGSCLRPEEKQTQGLPAPLSI